MAIEHIGNLKGPKGDPGLHVGPDAPTGDELLWLDTSGAGPTPAGYTPVKVVDELPDVHEPGTIYAVKGRQ